MNLHEAEMLNFILTAKWRCYIKQSGHCEEKEKNVNKKGNASRYLFSSCIMYLHEAEMQNEDVTIFSKADNTQKKRKRSYLLMSSWSGSCVFQASVHFRSPAPPVTRVLGRWFLCVDISVIGAAPALLRAQHSAQLTCTAASRARR